MRRSPTVPTLPRWLPACWTAASLLFLLAPTGAEPLRAQSRAAPNITSFLIDQGARNTTDAEVTLNWTFSGSATHYRVSQRDDFAGAPWLSLGNPPQSTGYTGIPFTLQPPAPGMPLRGRQTVYLQLRNGGQFSAVESARIGVLSRPVRLRSFPQTPTTEEYAFSSDAQIREVITHALGRGYTFDEQPVSGQPTCSFDLRGSPVLMETNRPPSAVIGTEFIAAAALGDPRCRFRLFWGRALADGWRVEDVRYQLLEDGGEWSYDVAPNTPGQGPGFALLLSTGLTNVALKITRLVLEGPSGAEWREAFP